MSNEEEIVIEVPKAEEKDSKDTEIPEDIKDITEQEEEEEQKEDQSKEKEKEKEKKKKTRFSGAKKFISKVFGGGDKEEEEQVTIETDAQRHARIRKQKVSLVAATTGLDNDDWKDGWKSLSVDHEDSDYNALVTALNGTNTNVSTSTTLKDEEDEEESTRKQEEEEDEDKLTESTSDYESSSEEDDEGESKKQTTFMVSQENEYLQRFLQERREMHSKFSISEIDRFRLYGQIIDYAMSSIESTDISDRILHVIAFKDRIMFADEYDHQVEVKFDKKKELKGFFVKKIFLSIPYAFECYVILENPELGVLTHVVIDIDKSKFDTSYEKDNDTFNFYKFEPKVLNHQNKPLFDGSNFISAIGFPHCVVPNDITTRKVIFISVAPQNIIYKIDFNVEGSEYDWQIDFKRLDRCKCEEVYNMDELYNEKQVIIHSHLQGFGIDSIEFAELKDSNEFIAFVSSVAGIAIFTGSGEVTDVFDRYSVGQLVTPAFKNYDEEDSHSVDLDRVKTRHRSILKVYDSLAFACITAKSIVFGRIYSDPEKTLQKAEKLQHKNPNDIPVDIEINNYHIFVCYKDEFHILMQPAYLKGSNSKYSLLSKVVYGVRMINTLGIKFDRSSIDKAKEDSNQSIFVYNASKLYRVSIMDQAKGFWRIFLDAALEIDDEEMEGIKSEYFKKSLELTELFDMNSKENKMAIFSSKADHHFKKGDFVTAAADYARTNRNFEEISMKFMEADPEDKKNGLYNYLYFMLHRYKTHYQFDKEKKIEECPEAVILSIWILELMCFKINQQKHIMCKFITVSCSEDEYRNQLEEKLVAEKELHKIKLILRKFVYNNKDILAKSKSVVYEIFLSNNFVKDFLFFATAIGDYLAIIQHCVTTAKSSEYEGNSQKEFSAYETANTILTNFCTDPQSFDKSGNDTTSPQNQIWYRYTALLMNHEKRDEIVKSFKRLQFLDPWELVPAILKYDTLSRQAGTRRRSFRQEDSQALEYLRYCIEEQKNENRTIHDLYVYLLANQRHPELLENFLRDVKESENVYFTKEYAFRVLVERKRWKACVLLYRLMELYEEAVDLALDHKVNNVKLAEETVLQYVEDLELKKRLAIKIVKYYVREENYKKAIDQLSDFSDVLTLDDILQYFPSKVHLDDLVNDLDTILDTYSFQNNRIEAQMRDATNDAELMRGDLSSMNIYKDIDYDDVCERCKSKVLIPNVNDPPERQNYFFYVFPSGQKFHLNCLYRFCKHNLEHRILAIDESAYEMGLQDALTNQLKQIREKRQRKQQKLDAISNMTDKSEKERELLRERFQFKIKQLDRMYQDVKQGKLQLQVTPIYTSIEEKEKNQLQVLLQRLRDTYENWHKARIELADALNDGSERKQLYWQLEFKTISKQLDELIGNSSPTDGPLVVHEITVPLVTHFELQQNELVV
ncbi:hypothetical protein ABK040_004133 [Willaertia magna]